MKLVLNMERTKIANIYSKFFLFCMAYNFAEHLPVETNAIKSFRSPTGQSNFMDDPYQLSIT
jgi:hypothetical protein